MIFRVLRDLAQVLPQFAKLADEVFVDLPRDERLAATLADSASPKPVDVGMISHVPPLLGLESERTRRDPLAIGNFRAERTIHSSTILFYPHRLTPRLVGSRMTSSTLL